MNDIDTAYDNGCMGVIIALLLGILAWIIGSITLILIFLI